AKREGSGFQVQSDQEPPPKFAFLGVRSCELHAIAIQDKVFLNGPYVAPTYQARREQAFIIAGQCGQAGGACLRAPRNTRPKATFGFDLALTELLESGRHDCVTEIGSERGADVMRDVPCREAVAAEVASAEHSVAEAAAQMGRTMDSRDLKDLLYRNYEHAR